MCSGFVAANSMPIGPASYARHDRRALRADLGHHAVQLLDEGLPRRQRVERQGIGAAGAPPVEADHAHERSEPAQEQLGERILPVGVEGAVAAGRQHQVDRARTEDLVGDPVGPQTGVAGGALHRGRISGSSASESCWGPADASPSWADPRPRPAGGRPEGVRGPRRRDGPGRGGCRSRLKDPRPSCRYLSRGGRGGVLAGGPSHVGRRVRRARGRGRRCRGGAADLRAHEGLTLGRRALRRGVPPSRRGGATPTPRGGRRAVHAAHGSAPDPPPDDAHRPRGRLGRGPGDRRGTRSPGVRRPAPARAGRRPRRTGVARRSAPHRRPSVPA